MLKAWHELQFARKRSRMTERQPLQRLRRSVLSAAHSVETYSEILLYLTLRVHTEMASADHLAASSGKMTYCVSNMMVAVVETQKGIGNKAVASKFVGKIRSK